MGTWRQSARAAALLVALAAAPASAHASEDTCAETGVTVVVDPGPLGGAPWSRCDADGADRSVAQVLARLDLDVDYVAGQPFVCRIDGRPDPSREPCSRIPPQDAYWGLFWSDGEEPGWSYATAGVATLRVPAGGSVGWRFQDGGERELPRTAPPTGAADRGEEPQTGESPAASTSPVPAYLGAGLALALVGAGAWHMRRRRRWGR